MAQGVKGELFSTRNINIFCLTRFYSWFCILSFLDYAKAWLVAKISPTFVEGTGYDVNYQPGSHPTEVAKDEMDMKMEKEWKDVVATDSFEGFPHGELPVAQFRITQIVDVCYDSRFYCAVIVNKEYDYEKARWLYGLRSYSSLLYVGTGKGNPGWSRHLEPGL